MKRTLFIMIAAFALTFNFTAAKAQDVAEGKAFLEYFYETLEADILDYDFIKQNLTLQAQQYLKDSYDYDCFDEGNCMASWLFFYDTTADVGRLMGRTIEPIGANTFAVTSFYDRDGAAYGDYEYGVKIELVKQEGVLKINSIETVINRFEEE